MIYPHIEIVRQPVKGKYRVNLLENPETLKTLYKGAENSDKLKEVLTPVLNQHPDIRVKSKGYKQEYPHVHIFRVIEDKSPVKAWVRTQTECRNPFENRKTYAQQRWKEGQTIAFDSISL